MKPGDTARALEQLHRSQEWARKSREAHSQRMAEQEQERAKASARPNQANVAALVSQVERLATVVEALLGDPRTGWLTVEEAADYCGVHPATVRAWVKAGKVDSIRIGRVRRFTREALEDLGYRSRERATANQPRRGPKPGDRRRELRRQAAERAAQLSTPG